MTSQKEDLWSELDNAQGAINKFIADYIREMQSPVDVICSLVTSFENQEDPVDNSARLETLQRTLGHMDTTLSELMAALAPSDMR